MNRRLFAVLLPLLAATLCSAAPVPVREIEFLLRQGTPSAEILATVRERKLAAPIDAATEQALRDSGADASLIAALKSPDMALTPTESALDRQRRMEQELRVSQSMAEDDAAHAARLKQQQQLAANLSRLGATKRMLDGKLVRLDGDQLKPYDMQQLEGVRVYAFYFSAMWCGPCRQFTPQLVEAYQQLKARYPGKFEIVFVSSDRDEFNMHEYMRKYRMPWPAVRFGGADDAIRQFAGDGIPWLVAVSDTAVPLTQNGVDKKYIDPFAILGGIEQIMPLIKN